MRHPMLWNWKLKVGNFPCLAETKPLLHRESERHTNAVRTYPIGLLACAHTSQQFEARKEQLFVKESLSLLQNREILASKRRLVMPREVNFQWASPLQVVVLGCQQGNSIVALLQKLLYLSPGVMRFWSDCNSPSAKGHIQLTWKALWKVSQNKTFPSASPNSVTTARAGK